MTNDDLGTRSDAGLHDLGDDAKFGKRVRHSIAQSLAKSFVPIEKLTPELRALMKRLAKLS